MAGFQLKATENEEGKKDMTKGRKERKERKEKQVGRRKEREDKKETLVTSSAQLSEDG